MYLQNKKALSPVISAIILIAVTVAVAVVSVSWMGAISFNFMQTDELYVKDCVWAPYASYANITVVNSGSSAVSIANIQVDGTTASDYTVLSDSPIVEAGESVTVQVSDDFVGNAKHKFGVVTGRGNTFILFINSTSNISDF